MPFSVAEAPTPFIHSRPRSADDALISRAVARVAAFWHLTNAQLGAILGLSPASVSRLRAGAYTVKPGEKPFELALLLTRLFRSLDAFMGSDDAAARAWLATPNLDLGARPLDLLPSITGLIRVADYVDDHRARV
ncbi:antitoxin Xre/MbcA/ParS toxin-binding domain-containing protein [Sandaracinobacteroides saxicola]|uniref:DUF2384 domain-containing protein n=1 Tax=Sandaracinobacteroides saxicola TaxID=2759707 RepID=A0A7G5IKN2_9SPHN|nr:antitoxin Xre/MbcA/ParS toxin-binding domain-containing protein [Sandaracinobacteroides saxicola]QMW23924.1 DUF2384 domain-containing protein [Sandaracinobacteroides saxicola]